jgi:hypothetical protein
MSRQRRDSETARITPYAKARLEDLVDQVSTTPPVLPVGEADLVGALIDAARRSPLEAVKAVIGTYRDTENEIAALEAVFAFLRDSQTGPDG